MLYTFILYYHGGVYINRVSATDVRTATNLWAEQTANDPGIQHLDGDSFRKVYAEEIDEFPPIEIKGCPNIWHLFFYFGRNRIDVHIVKTSEAPEPARAGASPEPAQPAKSMVSH